MLRDNRIRYIAGADYREGSELERLLKSIIDQTASMEVLEQKHIQDSRMAWKDS